MYICIKKLFGLPKAKKAILVQGKKHLPLFFFEKTTVKKGCEYAVPTILKFGMRNADGSEVLPLLSFKDVFFVKCLEVKNFVAYNKLTKKVFKNSLLNIQSSVALQKHILRKYLKSRPFLTKKEILEGGVAVAKLKIVKSTRGKTFF